MSPCNQTQSCCPTLCRLCILFLVIFVLGSSSHVSHGAQLPVPALLQPIWLTNEYDHSQSIAWGDVDGDGDLDLAVGNSKESPNRIYRNDDGVLASEPIWSSGDSDETTALLFGDFDADGALDLAAGNAGQTNKIYLLDLNESGTPHTRTVWSLPEQELTTSLAAGDLNGDGYLDLVVGNAARDHNRIYLLRPVQAGHAPVLTLEIRGQWRAAAPTKTKAVALGDINGDGYLDLVTGNDNGTANLLYRFAPTADGGINLLATQSLNDSDDTQVVALVDIDGDGDLDLATGNYNQPTKLFNNDNGTLATTPRWQSALSEPTLALAWGDMDGDGDPDLAIGNYGRPNRVYRNDAPALTTWLAPDPVWSALDQDSTYAVAWGDVDGDGDLDLATANGRADGAGQPNRLYRNDRYPYPEEPTQSWSAGQAFAVAWGDVDGDGDLDLAVGRIRQANAIYLNENGRLATVAAWESDDQDETTSIAWGDADGDGDLDLAVGNNRQANKIYLLELDGAAKPVTAATWASMDHSSTQSVAWGDVDGDGDLDLATGNGGEDASVLYLLDPTAANQPPLALPITFGAGDQTQSVVLGDVDGDGDLDLAVGNNGQPQRLYTNVRGQLSTTPTWSSAGNERVRGIALADVDGDGDLDLLTVNVSQPNQIFFNEGGTLARHAGWQSNTYDEGTALVIGDVDGDGDRDLLTGNNGQPLTLFLNEQGHLDPTPRRLTTAEQNTRALALGDANGDGALDLITANSTAYATGAQPLKFYAGHRAHGELLLSTQLLFGKPLLPTAPAPVPVAVANGNALAQSIDGGVVALPYQHYHRNPIRQLRAYYAAGGDFPNARADWQVALPSTSTLTATIPPAPSRYPTPTTENTGYFIWDIHASAYFGQSGEMVLRLEALPDLRPQPHQVTGPYQYGLSSAQSTPFRVRGTQIRVVAAATGQPLAGARLYHRAIDGRDVAQLLTDGRGQPRLTDGAGYLQGNPALQIGDEVLALAPISVTQRYTLYATSGPPTELGLDPVTIQQAGVQTLTVSADHPLLLFNLIVSLEWDARREPAYLAQLQRDIAHASALLYDYTNGQAALGEVAIYHDKGYWGIADVVIHAGNHIRPGAILGGSVFTPTVESLADGSAITYRPGQVRMGAVWNRFGTSDGTLGEDWARTLAHELGHYLFFLPDNYLGLSDDRQKLRLLDCRGSAMTEPYRNDYSEFLHEDEWRDACLATLAAHYLQRWDWATVLAHYPFLDAQTHLAGPDKFPINATAINVHAPVTPTQVFGNYMLPLVDGDRNNQALLLPERTGRSYLLKRRGTVDPTDDYVVALGYPVKGWLNAHGAAVGDHVCIFAENEDRTRVGCNELTTAAGLPIALYTQEAWPPSIQIRGVTTTTLVVTATGITVPDGVSLQLQLLPALGRASAVVPMTAHGADYVAQVTAADGAYYGFLRLWLTTATHPREWITTFISDQIWPGRSYDWGGRSYAWGGRSYDWGGRSYAWGGRSYAWGAPVSTGDGQVTVFPLNQPFSTTLDLTIQSAAPPVALDPWLTAVEAAQLIQTDTPETAAAVLIHYLQRERIAPYEDALQVYLLPTGATQWVALSTELDTERNLASAPFRGNGYYQLAMTLPVSPTLRPGWHTIGYPLRGQRPISAALQSIAGSYSIVYHADDTVPTGWRWYVPALPATFAPLVNTLDDLEEHGAYTLFLTDAATLYWNVGAAQQLQAAGPSASATAAPSAPALFYGEIIPTAGFTPTLGMTVTAEIDGVTCGETTVRLVDEKWAYVLAVRSVFAGAADTDCGAFQSAVTFRINGVQMATAAIWDNRQANRVALEASTMQQQFLPFIQR